MDDAFKKTVEFIKELYHHSPNIPLHAPRFGGNEEQYVLDCLRSTFVSSVGAYVSRFEEMLADYVQVDYAVATVNGTSALHAALLVAGVKPGDLVITQPLAFVATSNAIVYTGADPLYLDVDNDTLGLSPEALTDLLRAEAYVSEAGVCRHKSSGRTLAACVPMHTFGHPARIEQIVAVCDQYHIPVVEDAAESLGSLYQGKHTGTFGALGVYSFNGNKTITCGGGGAIVTRDKKLAVRAKHLTTQAKLPHAWAYMHDEVGYNYRMPNLNAALACAQLEQLDAFITDKRQTAAVYRQFFESTSWQFVTEPAHSRSNYWLNAVLLADRAERDRFLTSMNQAGIMTRPAWELMHKLPMFRNAICTGITNAEEIANRLVNLPSSVRQNG